MDMDTDTNGKFTINLGSSDYNVLGKSALLDSRYPGVMEVSPTSVTVNAVFTNVKADYSLSLDEMVESRHTRLNGNHQFIAIDSDGSPIVSGSVCIPVVIWNM